MTHLVITEDGERLTIPIKRLCVTELRQLADAALDEIDVQMGQCTCCHGSGNEHGDESFECFACGGTGKREDEARRLENDYDAEDEE